MDDDFDPSIAPVSSSLGAWMRPCELEVEKEERERAGEEELTIL
jgi:hypothetical protein